MCVNAIAHLCLCVWAGVSWLFSVALPLYLETGFLTEPRACSFSWVGRPVTPWNPSVSQSAGVTDMMPHRGAGAPNSGPPAYTASTLPTEPSAQTDGLF